MHASLEKAILVYLLTLAASFGINWLLLTVFTNFDLSSRLIVAWLFSVIAMTSIINYRAAAFKIQHLQNELDELKMRRRN